MQENIQIFNETEEELSAIGQELEKFLKFVLEKEALEDVYFNIIFVDSERIHEINRTYRHVDRPTDVISFALEDNDQVDLPIRLLGDIYISVAKAREQAEEYGHSLKREISFLALHGLLHLLGYDHIEKEDEKIMFEKQEALLDAYGIRRENV